MRLIIAVIIFILVASVIGYYAYQILIQGDDNNQTATLRWMGVIAIILLAGIAAFIGSVIRYRKPKSDIALVRTGGAKEKIVITSGLWVNTIIHEVKEISLNTMRLEVLRELSDSLITVDFNRADVEVVFYLKVTPDDDDNIDV